MNELQHLGIRQFYYGDYYPLTPYSQSKAAWMAYQLDRPDLGKGMVVALRRPESASASTRLVLRGLDGTRSYRIRNLDTKENLTLPGEQLLRDGLEVLLPTKPGSALFVYERE